MAVMSSTMGERDSQRLRAVVARSVAASTTSHAALGVGCTQTYTNTHKKKNAGRERSNESPEQKIHRLSGISPIVSIEKRKKS